MSMEARRVEPEILDGLPVDDPRAVESRRDLARVNALMLHAAAMALLLRRALGEEPPRTILDLGSGDGTFMLRVARRLAPRWRGVEVILLDRNAHVAPATEEAFRALHWRAEAASADVFEYLDRPAAKADAVTANLFLHHFDDAALRRMLAAAADRCRFFAACEPRRGVFPFAASRLLWAVGCNEVTRHDAPASVRAGFRGRELSALWPQRHGWALAEHAWWPFTHCFSASRETAS